MWSLEDIKRMNAEPAIEEYDGSHPEDDYPHTNCVLRITKVLESCSGYCVDNARERKLLLTAILEAL